MKTWSTILFIVLLGIAFTSCDLDEPNDSTLMTDLQDNSQVAATYQKYASKPASSHCGTSVEGQRVIVSGFSVFQGASFNISGTVAMSMANSRFWPSNFDLSSRVPSQFGTAFKGKNRTRDYGARAVTRSLSIDGKTYAVCFLLLDVQWDLAAAIIMNESKRFDPKLIIMTGRGGQSRTAIFESGAINEATSSAGFEADGNRDDLNRPETSGSKILKNGPQSISMTWDAEALKNATKDILRDHGRSNYSILSAESARPSNDYICNNVSYAVLAGHKGYDLNLAGGKISIPARNKQTKIGFFHFPYSTSEGSKEIFGWSKFIATAIKVNLPADTDDSSTALRIKYTCTRCDKNKKYCGRYDFTNRKWIEGKWERCSD